MIEDSFETFLGRATTLIAEAARKGKGVVMLSCDSQGDGSAFVHFLRYHSDSADLLFMIGHLIGHLAAQRPDLPEAQRMLTAYCRITGARKPDITDVTKGAN